MTDDAPFDEIIYCYNTLTGWFCTKRVNTNADEQFPLYNWGGIPGVWYPHVSKWVTREEYHSKDFKP